MRNMTITGSWRDRTYNITWPLSGNVPARPRRQRYAAFPWVPADLHSVAENQADAQFFMARTGRVVRFMDATGLRPFGEGWEPKLREIAPGLPMCADHPMLWIDRWDRSIVTVEIYAKPTDAVPPALAAWAHVHRWNCGVADPQAAIWNPHQGCQLMIVMAPARKGRGGDYPRVCGKLAQMTAGESHLAV